MIDRLPVRLMACSAMLVTLVVASPAHGQRGRLLVSLETLEARAVADSNDPAVQYELGLAYLARRKPDQAEAAFRQALAVESRFAPAYLGLAALPYLRRPKLWREVASDDVPEEWSGPLAEAQAWRRRAALLDPFVDLKVLVAVAPPREAMGNSKWEVALYTELVRGFEYFWDAQYAQAYRWFDDLVLAVRKDGRHPVPDWLLWYHGLAAAHQLNHAVAIADFQELLDRAVAAEEDPDAVHLLVSGANDLRYLLAVLHQRAKHTDDARRLLEEALTQDLSLFPAHSRLAEMHEARQRWHEAAEERSRALAALPEDPGLMLELATTYARMGWDKDAAKVLTEAAALAPRNARIAHLQGTVLERLGREAEARAAWERFLAIAPRRFGAEAAQVRLKLSAAPEVGAATTPEPVPAEGS